MKTNIKDQKGFATSDALIAVMIIALFTGLISNILYNIYIANSSLKRMSKATGYIVDMFEYIDKNYYDDVTIEKLTSYFNNKYYFEADMSTEKEDAEVKLVESEDEEVNTPFKAQLEIVKYNEIPGNENKYDMVKEINMKVNYKLGNKDQTIEMKRVKQREILEIPNKPDLSLVELQEGEKIYPIKKTGEEWIVCDYRDNTWYNYEKGNWAVILKTNRELVTGEKIDVYDLEENEELNVWIPRYAYDSTNNKLSFLFKNTNKTIEKQEDDQYSKLAEIQEDVYEIPYEFEEMQGKWTNDVTEEIAENLLEVYPAKNLE